MLQYAVCRYGFIHFLRLFHESAVSFGIGKLQHNNENRVGVAIDMNYHVVLQQSEDSRILCSSSVRKLVSSQKHVFL